MGREDILKRFLLIFIFVILGKCFYLQVIKYPELYQLSVKNCIRVIETGIPRGLIYDRNGRILAKDAPSANLVFVPYDLKNPEKVAEILSNIIEIDREYLIRKFNGNYKNPFDRIVLKRNLTSIEISLIEENSSNLPGVFIQEDIRRVYPFGKKMAHLLGYLGEISKFQLEKLKEKGYKMGDVIGQDGIEKYYDEFLRGIPGGIQVEVDALGHQRRVLGRKEGQPGNDIYLTIDATIQEIAYEELGDKKGCVCIMDPRNGEILALVSNPVFDPENILPYLDERKHPEKPFFNRVIKGQYPPGSIFKIITEIAALETGTIKEFDRIECSGFIEVADRVFHCWKEEGHGWVDINLALPFSCNIFFGTVGMKLGVSKLIEYAKKFELGKPTGIDLPGEASGYIPQPREADPLNLSIGQGPITTTPIQLLSLIATVANGGNIWQPFILKKIISPKGETIKENTPYLKKTIYIDFETLDILKKGLKNVVEFGTGVRAKVEGLEIAGKTGTAQRASSETELPTHGAFVCYAPFDNPKIAIIVYLDYGSSPQAAEIAGKILKRIFIPEILEEENETETSISQI
ncbi:MAG: penicillin-binding protein 2 [candidate division WOR-3 bacterium]|nr:penicillin-binding protein 2 [Candidatus Omnitrophota bacterium]MCM8806751.1 penicillin-binding protein 2 [Candidatus Omnitrophota bacterium]